MSAFALGISRRIIHPCFIRDATAGLPVLLPGEECKTRSGAYMKKNVIIIILMIIILALSGYLWWKNSQPQDITKEVTKIIKDMNLPESVDKIATKEFTNNTYKISLVYPENWQEKDLGGDKNVTEPIKRENIAYFYLPKTEATKGDVASSLVSVKLLRFVTEPDTKITSLDDWYKYIDQKVQNFIADQVLSANYKLISLDKAEKIDGRFTVVENYLENGVIRGKDYYIYADGEFYQFVSKAPDENFGMLQPYIEEIVKSFKKS